VVLLQFDPSFDLAQFIQQQAALLSTVTADLASESDSLNFT
jgi:hypothetical protein